MKKILITGATGLLGSTLKEVLQKNYKLLPFDIDITDQEKMDAYVAERVDWIVHTAAMTDVNRCEKEKELCMAVNVEGTRNIKNLAEKWGAKLLYISTVSVFDGKEGNYKEGDAPNPENFYNQTKCEGEEIVLEYEKGMVLRINLIGVHSLGSRGKNFMEWLVDSIKEHKNIKLFSDVVINPLSNWTIAEYIEKIIEINPTEKILHIGSKNNVSKADIGKIVMEKFGYKGKAEFVSVDTLEGPARPKQMWLSTEYTQKIVGAMPTLESEIEKILQKIS